jgi:hypothetical protein
MPENIPKFEQEQQPKPSFDYVEAAKLAKRKIKAEGPKTEEEKKARKQVKDEIMAYGAEGQPKRRIFDLEITIQRLELEKDQALAEGGIKLKVEKRQIDYDKYSQAFDYPTEKGFTQKVSQGDLMTDINWGLYYELAKEVPAEFKNDYIEAVYKAEIDKLHDQQLIIQRTELEREQIDEFLAETYRKVGLALEKGGEESAGLLFEKMIKNILSKVAFDFKKYGLKIEEPLDRVIADVEGKIDFIIKHKKNRAVKVEDTNKAEGEEETLNIQFTLKGYDTEEFEKKQRQVARALKENHNIHDLILISVPVEHDVIFGNYKKWQRHDKLPGGPENCFDAKVIVNFIKEILKNTELAKDEKFLEDVEKYFERKR